MLELVRRAIVVLIVAGVFLRCIVGELAIGSDTPRPRASPARPPRGLEWRTIRRLGGRIVAVRLQVVLA